MSAAIDSVVFGLVAVSALFGAGAISTAASDRGVPMDVRAFALGAFFVCVFVVTSGSYWLWGGE